MYVYHDMYIIKYDFDMKYKFLKNYRQIIMYIHIRYTPSLPEFVNSTKIKY